MGTTASLPLFSPRAGFVYAMAFVAMMAMCLCMPRILSFMPAVLGVFGVLWIKREAHVFPAFDKTLLLFFAGIVVLAGLSSLWAPDTEYAFVRSLKIAGLLFPVPALLACSGSVPSGLLNKNRVIGLFVGLLSLAAVILFFEYYSRFLITRSIIGMKFEDMPENMRNGFLLNRSTVLLALTCLPVALLVTTSSLSKARKYIYLALVFIPVIACLFATDSQTAQISALVAFLMLFYPAHRKKARQILLVVVLALMATAPFLIKPVYDAMFTSVQVKKVDDLKELSTMETFLRNASVPHRLEVWKFASEQVMQSPFIGNGVDSMRFLHAGYIMENMGTDTVMHPHNAVLEIWVEFGMIGIALVMALTVYLFRRIDGLPPLQQRYYTLLFIVILSILSTGYGLWQAWLLGMMNAITAMSIMAVRINSKQ